MVSVNLLLGAVIALFAMIVFSGVCFYQFRKETIGQAEIAGKKFEQLASALQNAQEVIEKQNKILESHAESLSHNDDVNKAQGAKVVLETKRKMLELKEGFKEIGDNLVYLEKIGELPTDKSQQLQNMIANLSGQSEQIEVALSIPEKKQIENKA